MTSTDEQSHHYYMMTLEKMSEIYPEELRALALHVPCRYYSQALSQVASGLDALALGDLKLARMHGERARVAYLRAQEVESDRVRRCIADVRERGSQAQ